eukprot:scaffold2636_cov340-Pavlova_lutheri.AAC.51
MGARLPAANPWQPWQRKHKAGRFQKQRENSPRPDSRACSASSVIAARITGRMAWCMKKVPTRMPPILGKLGEIHVTAKGWGATGPTITDCTIMNTIRYMIDSTPKLLILMSVVACFTKERPNRTRVRMIPAFGLDQHEKSNVMHCFVATSSTGLVLLPCTKSCSPIAD